MEKVFSSRRAAICFLIVFMIKIAFTEFLCDYLWVIPIFTFIIYIALCAAFTTSLFNAKKKLFACIFPIIFILSALITFKLYGAVKTEVLYKKTLPNIETVSIALLDKYEGQSVKIKLDNEFKSLSRDGYAIIEGDTVWFLERKSPLDGNNFYVYDKTPSFDENYLTDNIYYFNE